LGLRLVWDERGNGNGNAENNERERDIMPNENPILNFRQHKKKDTATVEIAGLDIYDPIRDEVQSRDVHDIAYWMLDDAYDGSNFVVRQVFFCGGDKDEFDQWKKELNNLAAASAKKKTEQTLRIEIDDEAFASA
jgi:adenine-specific DNA-methyltransferase